MNRWDEMLLEVFGATADRESFLSDCEGWWRATDRADMMLAIAGMLSDRGDDLHRATVAAGCACVLSVLPAREKAHPSDRAPRAALKVAMRWCSGGATDAEVSAAARAATSSAWDSRKQKRREVAVAASFAAVQALSSAGAPARYIPIVLRRDVAGTPPRPSWAETVREKIPVDLFVAAVGRWRYDPERPGEERGAA